jgi:hypothetical protein
MFLRLQSLGLGRSATCFLNHAPHMHSSQFDTEQRQVHDSLFHLPQSVGRNFLQKTFRMHSPCAMEKLHPAFQIAAMVVMPQSPFSMPLHAKRVVFVIFRHNDCSRHSPLMHARNTSPSHRSSIRYPQWEDGAGPSLFKCQICTRGTRISFAAQTPDCC